MLNLQFKNNCQNFWRCTAVLAFLLFITVPTINAQTTTFASFLQRGASRDVGFTNNTTSGNLTTFSSGFPVRFFYEDPVASTLPPALQTQQNATMTITSTTSTAGTQNGGNTIQPIDGLTTISFRRDSDNANLLTIEIASTGSGLPVSGAYPAQGPSASTSELSGSTNGNSANFNSSTPAQTIRFTSDFLDFTQTVIRSSQLGFTGFDVPYALNANSFVNSFTAQSTGSFSSNPSPFYNPPPTSTLVNVGGRIVNASGRGVSKAQVSFIDGSGVTRYAISNILGYYRFSNVYSGQTIVLSAASKNYTFTPQVVSVVGEMSDLNFIALGTPKDSRQ